RQPVRGRQRHGVQHGRHRQRGQRNLHRPQRLHGRRHPVTVNVTSGAASASYVLPAGTSGGAYTLKAAYNGTVNFAASTDTGHTLTINPTAATTSAANASATYTVASQTLTLTPSVSSAAITVSERTETFTILTASTTI